MDRKTLNATPEGVREYHSRYLMAINNPLRREILRALKGGEVTLDNLQEKTGLDSETLEWHLNILENGFCVEKISKDTTIYYRLTKEGEVVDYIKD